MNGSLKLSYEYETLFPKKMPDDRFRISLPFRSSLDKLWVLVGFICSVLIKMRRCGIIGNEATLCNIANDVEVSSYRSPMYKWAKPILNNRHIGQQAYRTTNYKRPWVFWELDYLLRSILPLAFLVFLLTMSF